MTLDMLEEKCKELRLLQRRIEESERAAETIKTQLKAHMGEPGELMVGDYRIKWQEYPVSRVDTKKLKLKFPDLYDAYSVTSVSTRFQVV